MLSGQALHSLPSREADAEGNKTESSHPAQGAAAQPMLPRPRWGRNALYKRPGSQRSLIPPTRPCTLEARVGAQDPRPPSITSAFTNTAVLSTAQCAFLKKQLTHKSALPTACFHELRDGFSSPSWTTGLGFDLDKSCPPLWASNPQL